MRGSAVFRQRAPIVARLRQHFGLLRPREREMMGLRYGSGDLAPTLDVIAARMGVTRARVQQLEFTALLRLGAEIDRSRVVIRCVCGHAKIAHHYARERRRREHCCVPVADALMGCPCNGFEAEGSATLRRARRRLLPDRADRGEAR